MLILAFEAENIQANMIVQVDNEHANGGYLAQVLSVTPEGMFSVITDGKTSWSIMSNRLSPVKFYPVCEGMKIKDDDLVAYTFPKDHAAKFAGKTFVAEVRTIWKEKNEAGVLAEYGQDIVNLADCRKVICKPEQVGLIVEESTRYTIVRSHALSLGDAQFLLENNGKCFIEWEENQCDGCKARIPLLDGYIHRKVDDPIDPFGIGCTAHRYDVPRLIDGKIIIHLI